jgi:hypothetical protein
MKLDSKKILTIGAGAVVGYLIFCKFMKRADEKSSEGGAIGEGASTEEGGIGGGGGGGFGGGGGSIAPLPPVIAPIITTPLPTGYVVVGGNTITPRENLLVNNVNSSIPNADAVANVGRGVPSPTPAPVVSKPLTDVAGNAVVARPMPVKDKFADFDGDANFQDQLL